MNIKVESGMNINAKQSRQIEGQSQNNFLNQQNIIQQIQLPLQVSSNIVPGVQYIPKSEHYNDKLDEGSYQNSFSKTDNSEARPLFFSQYNPLQQLNEKNVVLTQLTIQQTFQQPQKQVSCQNFFLEPQQFYNQQLPVSYYSKLVLTSFQCLNQQSEHQHQFHTPSLSNSGPTNISKAHKSIKVNDHDLVFWKHQEQLSKISRSIYLPHCYAKHHTLVLKRNKNPYFEMNSLSLLDVTNNLINSLNEQEKVIKNNNVSASKALYSSNSSITQNKFSLLDSDDHEYFEEQRIRKKTQRKQPWTELDLSGQGFFTISPNIFQYEFLESLYLNNNNLTTIPPIISKLKSLRVLDLSQNKIGVLSPELGLCFNLKFLYLFDNNIQTLPFEFGNLIELLFLGIEGNPMDLNISNLLAEKGTQELIKFLRNSKQNLSAPNSRTWLYLQNNGNFLETEKNLDDENFNDNNNSDTFTIMSYNILCQHYATSSMYKYTPAWALDWDYRKNVLQEEISNLKTDIICMQEVETRAYHEFWLPFMLKRGYKGIFLSKTRSKTMNDIDSKKVDGCATFYKSNKFVLLQKQNFEYNSVCMGSEKYKKTRDLFNRFMNKDNIALISFMQQQNNGEKIVIINTHLHWDPAFNDVKALQVGILLEEVQEMIKKFFNISSYDEIKNFSLIICGDFNSTKENAVHQLFSTGTVQKHVDLKGRDYGKFTDDGFKHNFKLKSAYEAIGELPFTNFSPNFTDVIDYIWYLSLALQVKGVLGKIDEVYVNRCIGFPNAHFPSDHIPLATKFQFKKKNLRKHVYKHDSKTTDFRKS